MPEYIYQFSDTACNCVEPAALTNEILASSIITALDHIDTGNELIHIWFVSALSSGEITALDAVVAAHEGAKEPNLQNRVDASNSTVLYIGYAARGTTAASASWTIKRIQFDGAGNPTTIQWSDSNAVWNDRTSTIYS